MWQGPHAATAEADKLWMAMTIMHRQLRSLSLQLEDFGRAGSVARASFAAGTLNLRDFVRLDGTVLAAGANHPVQGVPGNRTTALASIGVLPPMDARSAAGEADASALLNHFSKCSVLITAATKAS
jgi:hypothetical protein